MDNPTVNTSKTNHSIYTPRTPRMRERQRFDLTARSEEDEEIDLSGLNDLVGQTWNIYAVSALFGFQRDDVSLKLYSKKLREEIAKHLSHEDLTYDANFSIMESITSQFSHENYSAIKIEVIAKTSNSKEEKSTYKGILLSWKHTTPTQIEPDIENSTRLPLLLCRGTRNCMDTVHDVIGHMFDCLVMALPLNEDDLKWLVPITIISVKKDEQSMVSGEVHMEYTVPELPVTDTIKVKFDTSELRKILRNIIDESNNTINTILDRKHIEQFYEVLYVQMLTIGGLQLGLCTLRRINLPGITIMENRTLLIRLDIDFVCRRGALKTLFSSRYKKFGKGWIICASKYRGTIYLCEFYADKGNRQPINETKDKYTWVSREFKFKQYMVADHPSHKPDLSVPLNECEDFCCVFKTKFGNHSLLYTAEIDGISSKQPIKDTLIGKEFKFIELKTMPMCNNSKDLYRKLNPDRVSSWWSKNYLTGIDTTICGLKVKNTVRTIEEYPTHILPRFSKINCNVNQCKMFCKTFLDHVKGIVIKDYNECMYKFQWDPSIQNTVHYNEEPPNNEMYLFLKSWFVSEVEKHFPINVNQKF